MSTDWGWRCRTCKYDHTVDGLRQWVAAEAMKLRHELGALGRAMVERGALNDYRFASGGSYDAIPLDWFAAHSEHEMVLVDEYGREEHQCSKPVKCGECCHTVECVLTGGHEGECSRKATS